MPRYAISHQPHDDLRLQRTGVALSKSRDLTPRGGRARCGRTTLVISPQPAVSSHRVDYFGNPATFFSIEELHWQSVLTANHLVDVSPRIARSGSVPPSEVVRDRLPQDRNAAALDVYQFAFGSRYASPSPELADYVRASFPAERPLVAAAMDLMAEFMPIFNMIRKPRRSRRRCSKCSASVAASARTSPTCKSRVCLYWVSRPAM